MEQRSRNFIDATVSVVARQGYDNASLTAIAREAGMSKGLLWHHFSDGDDLMEQTARATLRRLREAVARDVDLSAPIPQVIRAAIERAAALRDTHRAHLRALKEIVLNLRNPDGSRRLGMGDYEETYELQATLFQRGVDDGSLRPVNPRYLAATYQGAVDAMLEYLDNHPGVDVEDYAASVASILLDGVTASDQWALAESM